MSTGMKKIGLVQVMIHDPKILLDEPTANLDPTSEWNNKLKISKRNKFNISYKFTCLTELG